MAWPSVVIGEMRKSAKYLMPDSWVISCMRTADSMAVTRLTGSKPRETLQVVGTASLRALVTSRS
ncbi:hypothetical protein D3C77_734440 [compost metagenome]